MSKEILASLYNINEIYIININFLFNYFFFYIKIVSITYGIKSLIYNNKPLYIN
jgi:hypothetical protein